MSTSSSPSKKTIFITGGNAGLGLEIIKSLLRSASTTTSYDILLGSRSLPNAHTAIAALRSSFPATASTLTAVQCDLASDTSLTDAIATIAAHTERGHLDILVNNAGAAYDSRIASGTMGMREAWNASWDTNVTGTQVLTSLAVPLLLKAEDPRLIFLASGTSTLAGTESKENDMLKRLNGSPPAGWPKPSTTFGGAASSYRSTKTGLNMLMREWVRVLGNDGVKIWAVSPGFLATGLNDSTPEKLRAMGALDPVIGADFTVSVIEGKRDQDVGKVIRRDAVQNW
ncbi:MAG: hypothetical protein OHK93_001187 [Ramalina farinacea]|uniref:Uncharacterized protein n=1 Tax=Ramalina farinacea TaxID=258253 RepID=A0AA43QP22_9LECA|nr:hypothetical protein [Ramalina farinacea]